MSEALFEAFLSVFARPDIWLIIVASAVYGIAVGSIPGLTATMAVALFVPMAYWLDPVAAMAAIVTMVACAIFAGDLPTVFLRIPGTPASAAYADDAYAFARRGDGERVLVLSLFCSAIGGMLGAVAMLLLGGQLAQIASWFSVTEYFWLYAIGLACSVVVAEGAKGKAILSLLIGLLFSTVGLSAAHMEPRFTFGIPALYQGIAFIPAMIGLFGLSEVLFNLSGQSPSSQHKERVPRLGLRKAITQTATELRYRASHRKASTARSSLIGLVVGMLPGAGCDIAAWVSYAASKRKTGALDPATSQSPESQSSELQAPLLQSAALSQSQRQSLDQIGDATTANNAALAGSWIPALVFGIPGDSITAIVIGVLMMKNLTPGPQIFIEQTSLVYSIYLLFFVANLILLPVGFLAIRLGGHLVRIPKQVLFPLVVVFCVTGSYSLNSSLFDVLTMLVMGIVGFLLARHAMPAGPVVLGIILGGPLEERLVQSLAAAGGNPAGLVSRPLSVVLALVFIAILVSMIPRRRPAI